MTGKQMTRAIAAAVLASLLAACGVPTTEELIEDKALLAEAVLECEHEIQVSMGNPDSELCRNALEAYQTLQAKEVNSAMGRLLDAFGQPPR